MKAYTTPKMSVIDMESEQELLSASGEDNPYWKAPEEKEGCETPWWCP